MEKRNNIGRRTAVIWALIILGFCAIEFPGILLVKNRVYPFILGMPFLYGYLICCWAFMCSVLFYAFRTGWGKHHFTLKKHS